MTKLGDIVAVSDPTLIHQLRRVFRLHEGDKVILFDGVGIEHVSEIVSHGDEQKENMMFRIIETRMVELFSERRIALAVSLIKKDNFEWVVQKATELGVSEFIPLVSERSEKKSFNIERARKIMIEACEQSGRADVPTIHEQMTLGDFLRAEQREILVFHTEDLNNGENFSASKVSMTKNIVACIGPEGGWSENEIQMFKDKGAKISRLNTPILRAETAAIVVATILLVKQK